MLKKFIFFIIFIILTFFGLGYSTLHSPKLASFFMRTIFNFASPQIKLISLDWEEQIIRWPTKITLKNISWVWHREGLKEHFSLDLFDLQRQHMVANQWRGTVKNLDMQSEANSIKDLNISVSADFEKDQIARLKGDMEAFAVNYNRLKINDIHSKIEGRIGEIRLVNFFADCYEGKIRGEILVDYKDNLSYIIQSELTNVDISRLRDLSESFFSQIEGRVNGDIKLSGNSEEVVAINGFFDMASGAMIKAVLLSQIVGYLPQSIQRQELEGLIAENGQIALDKATFTFQNIDHSRLKTNIDLESQKLNLDINLAIDINLDTDFAKLIMKGKK